MEQSQQRATLPSPSLEGDQSKTIKQEVEVHLCLQFKGRPELEMLGRVQRLVTFLTSSHSFLIGNILHVSCVERSIILIDEPALCLLLQVQQGEASLPGHRALLPRELPINTVSSGEPSSHPPLIPLLIRLSAPLQEMTRGNRYKTIRWRFMESLEPPKVVHARCPDMVTKGNLYGQVTVRMHSKQVRNRMDSSHRSVDLSLKSIFRFLVLRCLKTAG